MFQRSLADNKICPIGALQSEYKVIPERMRVQVGHLRCIVVGWLTETLAVGRDEGHMVYAGSSEDQATMVLAALQGALQNARAEGQPIFSTVVNQVKRMMTAR